MEGAHVVTGSKGTRKHKDRQRSVFHPGTPSAFQREDKALAHQETARDVGAIRKSDDFP